jgi:uncharacterized RDD family membrane protein YckC
MIWYYEDQGRQAGPIDDAELERLAAAGTIGAGTLVWREGWPGWQPYATVHGGPAAAANLGVCSQCRRSFATSEMVRFGEQWVCASCKPMYVQRLREGASLPGQFVYGGFWIRAGARLLDGLLLFAVNMLLSLPMIFYSVKLQTPTPQGPPPAFFVVTCLTYLLQFATQAAYEIYFLGRKGATPGKMACKLRVVRADGTPLTFGRAAGRYFANLLSAFTFGIGYIIAAFDDQKRALHDHICDTRVVVS